MIFQVMFKTPDAFDHCDVDEEDIEVAKATFDKFVEYGENITIEFDTEKQTAKVV